MDEPIRDYAPVFAQMQQQIRDAVEICAPGTEIMFRAMFGGHTGYVEGRNFASLSNVGLALKIADADQDTLLALPGAKRLQYEPDAPMSKQSIVVPEDMRADAALFAVWVGKSIAYVATLPAPKPRATKKPKSG